MRSARTFACCRFSAASNLLALPVECVRWVHDSDDDDVPDACPPDAPHISRILDVEFLEKEQRILELNTDSGTPLFLAVDLPIGVEEFTVESVLPESAMQTDAFTDAVINQGGEFILLLNGPKISQALRALIPTTGAETERE